MKKIVALMLLSISIVLLSACKSEDAVKLTYTHDEIEIHHFRTNAYNYEGPYQPDGIIIDSLMAFEYYIDDVRSDFYVTESTRNQTQSFYDFSLTLDQTLFETNKVVLIRVEETSGSNRHAVDEVFIENNTLHVSIERIIPKIGTDDMAFWHIVLIVPHDFGNYDDVSVEVFKN